MKSTNLKLIIDRVINHTLDEKILEDKQQEQEAKTAKTKGFSTAMALMTPVKPMLAKYDNKNTNTNKNTNNKITRVIIIIISYFDSKSFNRACKSTAEVMKRCTNGMFAGNEEFK